MTAKKEFTKNDISEAIMYTLNQSFEILNNKKFYYRRKLIEKLTNDFILIKSKTNANNKRDRGIRKAI